MNSFVLIAQSPEKQEQAAREFSKTLLIDPLDLTIINQNSLDDNSSQTPKGIALVRFISEKILLKPLRGQKKALIIIDAQTLSIPAQNALLKMLEEPPESTIIIVGSDNPLSLLPTILSRCQILSISVPDNSSEVFESFILQNDYSNRLAFLKAEELGKDKTRLLQFLRSEMESLHTIMLSHTSDKNLITRLSLILGSCLATYKLIKTTNVNPRFALENLFLSI